MPRAYRIALGGICAGLSIVLLACTGLFPYATAALPALAGFLTAPVVIESGKRWAVLTYAAVAAVAVFITPDISAAFAYIFFFGYYPILKSLIERLRKIVLEWILKLAAVNLAITAVYLVVRSFFSLAETEVILFGIDVTWAFWIAANVVFVLYDIVLTRLIGEYVRRLRPKLAGRGSR